MSIWSRVGNAFKAGAKSAVDTALTPSSATAPAAPAAPQISFVNVPAAKSGLPSWVIPAAVGGVVLFLVARK